MGRDREVEQPSGREPGIPARNERDREMEQPSGRELPWGAALRHVAIRPALWPTALRQAFRFARPGWWGRPPFLPTPDRATLRFRLETQYGAEGPMRAGDLVRYLEWCRDQERLRRSG